MLFHSSLRKELARSFGATLVVLVTIVMTMTLIRTLGQANRGSVNPQEVMMVMGYTVLGYLPPILTLCLFVAIVGTLSRMYTDSEMVIWFSAGRGLSSLVRPLFGFAWPVLAGVAVLALVIWPWANQQTQELKDRYGSRGDLERVAPGQFQESASGTRVFFLDKDTPDNKSGKNIFISAVEHGKQSITTARTGRVVTEGDAQFLLLSNGQRLENTLDGRQLKVSVFDELGNRVGSGDLGPQDDAPAKTLSTYALMADPTRLNLGELAWRLGLALAAFNFVVIAITVSSVNPRAGRSGNLVFALFAFIVYYNLLNLGQSWISGGRTSFAVFMVALHGGTMLVAATWLGKQHNNWSLPRLRLGRRAPGATA
ncbi:MULTISPECIES: LPS export ABC transporter permease LptF [Ramlibacter]|uniref:Lipopolysaccharide export system permease protein LptF n=1 Tax=Ramlibacter pinisoli TaxID=2682844 RepID=A0A6N8IVV0_9BURK|nr:MULTISPECIES: LPS export ABC transporter permease LptF [Ramlibacter]MBA2960865.1 LPS export ABC transporter permease LptF [Ramlibacter sp. CGMCC 1.13660]MVQ30812.1 LPS export ABC transporter permease LptF [Ramlibacter pinisoli]